VQKKKKDQEANMGQNEIARSRSAGKVACGEFAGSGGDDEDNGSWHRASCNGHRTWDSNLRARKSRRNDCGGEVDQSAHSRRKAWELEYRVTNVIAVVMPSPNRGKVLQQKKTELPKSDPTVVGGGKGERVKPWVASTRRGTGRIK